MADAMADQMASIQFNASHTIVDDSLITPSMADTKPKRWHLG
jgi:hypothetical protein